MLIWISAHWPMLAATLGPAFGVFVATVINVFGDPDHDPQTPPPKWVVPFVILQGFLTLRAAPGRKGLDGVGDGRWSVPGHFPQIGDPVPAKRVPPPSPPLALAMLSMFMALPMACAHVPPGPVGPGPSPEQYTAAFTQCLQTENVQALTGSEGQQIIAILMAGGFSSQQLLQKIEAVAISAGGAETGIIVSCAVLAWFELNPVGQAAKPTPSQAAARLYQVRHLKALKQKHSKVKLDGPSPANEKREWLLNQLADRDSKVVDLCAVNQQLSARYGAPAAPAVVRHLWAGLSGEPLEKAADVVWLQGQNPRVRDVAWLISYAGDCK